jgi:predicted thioredoxin/glutaredoxin
MENSSQSGREKKKSNKDYLVKVRVTEEEHLELEKASEEYESLSAFVRQSWINQIQNNKKKTVLSQKVEKQVINLIREVNAVGKNINQVARYVNFLEGNGIVYAPAIERFNQNILAYTDTQIKIENLLKQILKEK